MLICENAEKVAYDFIPQEFCPIMKDITCINMWLL